ncbi:helix-turn-helix domain-containing protein [Aldersonia sp. NBC_00410]|uniref:PucR family transcriptional regulator n=1 Tax=Aldersonia sp. NBC_00410 TaxID=2975954 RepID=UPI002255DAF1|nr:helix-turn-helix domain-containing protein [Aldersonia sp. NBC_00410]MCX5045112.1 helix-turn-helix domain-containing protein [Aldersonia sp. NBC_00410]
MGSDSVAWLHRLLPDLLDGQRLESIVAYTDGHILRDVPELEVRTLRSNLHTSSIALGRIMLPNLVTGVTPDELPDEAYVLAESIAHSGLDLRVLLRVFRSGQQAMIRTLSDEVSAAPLDSSSTRELVGHVASCVADWAGSTVEILSANFPASRVDDPGGRVIRRRATVRAIVAGSVVDPRVAQLRLGYGLDDTHLAYVLWLDEETDGRVADLERAAHRIAGHLDARGSFTLACGDRTVWAWARTDRRATIDIAIIAAVASARVSFGLPAPGLAGFRRSHLEALAAQQMQRQAARSGRVVLYDAVELDFLVSRDAEAMHAFVQRELAGLLESSANVARLRETLGCYLEAKCSIEAAARELGVHRNTIRYRLDRVEKLLGHSIESRRLELEIALRCATSAGPSPHTG